ncbi:MAG: DUF1800 domain-containing protein [Planctomycetota bacterium]
MLDRRRRGAIGLGVSASLFLGLSCSTGSDAVDDQRVPDPVSRAAAVRFLNRATFGASLADTDVVAREGYARWLDGQFQLPPTLLLPTLVQFGCAPELPNIDDCPDYDPDPQIQLRRIQWWTNATYAPDQLRQRVAFALSEIFVASALDDELADRSVLIVDYYDTLARGAFGTYRELLEDVTLHPVMGVYLSMLKNRKADPVEGTRPDENFAREVMQLFSIGLAQLDPTGQPLLDAQGEPIPTYDQDVIVDTARALTGWTYASDVPPNGNVYDFLDLDARLGRMVPWPAFHDTGAKTIVGGIQIPAGLSAEGDLAAVLDALATHPNVGPFMGRQLIQRLVTSNPSPAYVGRISAVWDDDGSGVRGNLGAVVRAILLDPEALGGHAAAPTTFGKVREPILRVTGIWRAFEATGTSNEIALVATELLGQAPMEAPSVFNFFSPSFTTSTLASQGLVAPELQISTHSAITRLSNALTFMILEGNDLTADPNYPDPVLQLAAVRSAAGDVTELVDLLDERMLGGTLESGARTALETYLETIPNSGDGEPAGARRAAEAIALLAMSPAYGIQR